MENKISIYILLGLFVVGCASPNFMGAEKIGGTLYCTERWYKNPDYNVTLPSGTAGYGASAEVLRDKFIVKYYVNDNQGSTKEIPKHDMWFIKHNGKRFNKQDDDNFFFYVKNKKGKFVKEPEYYYSNLKYHAIKNHIKILPIKKCYNNGFCELYESYNYKDEKDVRYIKKSILLKRLSDD
jgi:hypothetical protein